MIYDIVAYAILMKSQSHRTAQGDSKETRYFEHLRAVTLILSQSHGTDQGNSERTSRRIPTTRSRTWRNPTVLIRAIPRYWLTVENRANGATSQFHRTDQSDSKVIRQDPTKVVVQLSQSHRTAQGNSKGGAGMQDRVEVEVAIPPYCSGQFQAEEAFLTSGTNIFESQSHRTAQGDSKAASHRQPRRCRSCRNPTVLLRAIPRATTCRWSTFCATRRNPTVLIRAIPRRRATTSSRSWRPSRNPTVLLRAIPRTFTRGRLLRISSRNPPE